MKKYFKLYSFLLFAAFLFNSCRNPAYELNVLFDADVIQYKATIILKDADGAVLPNNLSVSVTGQDAGSIYDFSGTKQLYAPSGIITLGVTPKEVPTTQPLSFSVIVKGPGYEDKNIPVTITPNQFNQVLTVTMMKVSVSSPVSTVVTQDAALAADGKTATATSVSTPSSATVAETTTITIPAGTQMKDAAGNVLTGSQVTIRAINYAAKDPATIDMFPGGSLSASNVIGENGATGSAFFVPAGFTNVQMFVDGVEVKNFATPINISVQVDPTFKTAATGQVIKAGDKLSIYSYDTATGQFKFESIGTVALDAKGKLAVSFPISHLTIFVVGDVMVTTACQEPTVTFVAPWLTEGTTAPVVLEILSADGTRSLANHTIVMKDGLVQKLSGLPATAVRYVVKDNAGKVLAEGAITDPCAGTATSITIGAPTGPAIQNITMELNVVCPGKGSILVPNFDLFYKPAGAPDTEFKVLGTAEKGLIKTTKLSVGSSYDFRATWQNRTINITNRVITDLDLSTTAGNNQDKVGNNGNYQALLIEACKSI